MALARYTDTFWYPSGIIAGNVPASVFPVSSSALADLWTDATGTVPLTNPLLTTGTGVLDFWAESGEYWIHLDTETFPVTVGMSQEQADLSTGIASGGEISVNGLNPLAIDISAVDGYIVNYLAGDQSAPGVIRVKTAAQTVPLDAAALLRTVTWWVMDSTGAVIQQALKPGNVQNRTHLTLGATSLVGGVINADQSLPVILPQLGNQLVDLMDSLGPFVIDGNVITANGANLMINHSSGPLFSRAWNHFAGAVITNDPHVTTTIAQTPAQFRYGTRSTTVFGAPVTNVDVANFDVGGVITPIGGGANTSTIHRLWLFASNTAPDQMVMQYGQTAYSSLSAAVNAIGAGTYVVNPAVVGISALVSYIAVTRTATNLSDPTQCVIVHPGKFAAP